MQPASAADIWRWVHSVYGDELGLTSDDEHDYVSPYVTPEGSMEGSKVKVIFINYQEERSDYVLIIMAAHVLKTRRILRHSSVALCDGFSIFGLCCNFRLLPTKFP